MMRSLRVDWAVWNHRNRRARNAYHAEQNGEQRRPAGPCAGCGVRTEAASGVCRACRKKDQP